MVDTERLLGHRPHLMFMSSYWHARLALSKRYAKKGTEQKRK